MSSTIGGETAPGITQKNRQSAGWRYILSAIGPGLILAATTIGPGSVVNSSVSGSMFGYTLVWWFIIILLFRGLYGYGMNRYTIVTGRSVTDGIRLEYGKVWAILVGIAAFIGQLTFGIGNFTGTGMGLNMIFPGIPLKTGAVIITLISIAILLMKDLYRKMEIYMKILIALMVLTFLVALIMAGGPSWGEMAAGVVPAVPAGSLTLMLSLLGTTASLATVAYGSSLAKDKRWTKDDIINGGMKWDVIISVAAIGIISFTIWFISAELLRGKPISTGADLANALAQVLGAFVKPLIGVGFLAAAVSSLIMAPKIGINLLMSGLGKPTNMDSRVENVVSICMLVFAAIVGLLAGKPPVQLMILAQIGAVINTPILGALTILLLNKPEMGEFKISRLYTALLSIAYVVILYNVINNIINLIK